MKARVYNLQLASGRTEVVIITERWHSPKCKDYNYCGYAVKDGKVHEFMNSVSEWNKKLRDGRAVELCK